MHELNESSISVNCTNILLVIQIFCILCFHIFSAPIINIIFIKKVPLSILRKGLVIFSQTVFKLKTTTYNHIEKSYRLVNICKTAYSSQGGVKNVIFEKIFDYFVIKCKNDYL